MPPNGTRVTITDVYNILGEYRQEVNACLTELRAQNGQQGERIATVEQCTKDHAGRLEDTEAGVEMLKVADRRWGALGAIVGPVLGAVAGFFAGRQ